MWDAYEYFFSNWFTSTSSARSESFFLLCIHDECIWAWREGTLFFYLLPMIYPILIGEPREPQLDPMRVRERESIENVTRISSDWWVVWKAVSRVADHRRDTIEDSLRRKLNVQYYSRASDTWIWCELLRIDRAVWVRKIPLPPKSISSHCLPFILRVRRWNIPTFTLLSTLCC